MKTTTKILTVAATLALALSLAAPLQASCGTTALIKTERLGLWSFLVNPQFQNFGINAGNPAYYFTGAYGPATYTCFSCSPIAYAIPPLTGGAEITFWRTGTGNPAIGAGDDSGTFDVIATGGFYFQQPTPNYIRGGRIFSTWQPAGIDGCVGGTSCMCLLVTDQDGTDGSWAVLGGQSNPSFNTNLDIGGSDGVANYAPIKMVNQAAPVITASARNNTSFDVDLTVTVPAQTGGDYATTNGCACGPIGYKVLQQVVARGATPPSNRDISGWTEPALAGLTVNDASPGPQPTNGTALGSMVKVRSLCGASNTDVYLTAQLIFDSGFGTTHVSGNSTRVECGASLADPDDKPTTPVRPRGDRPQPRRR